MGVMYAPIGLMLTPWGKMPTPVGTMGTAHGLTPTPVNEKLMAATAHNHTSSVWQGLTIEAMFWRGPVQNGIGHRLGLVSNM